MADAAKERGNALMKSGKFEEAAAEYSRAIDLDATNHIFYSNRSAAYCRTGEFSLALADANRCVDMAPTWAKGYSRQGAAYEGSGDAERAQRAYAKCAELGGSAAALRAAAAGATSSGVPGRAAPDVLSIVQLGLRVLMLGSVVQYMIPFVSSDAAFQIAMLAAAAAYGIHLFRAHGKPERSQRYAQLLATDTHAHYLITAILFAFAGQPRFLLLMPHVLMHAGHVADYIMREQPQLAARAAPTLNQRVLPQFIGMGPAEWAALPLARKWQMFNAASIRYAAALEVGIGFNLVFEALTGRGSLLVVMAHWNFMRIRYKVSADVRTTFAAVDQRLSGLLSRVPAVYNVYAKVREVMAGMVRDTPPGAQTQGGGLAGLASRCSIM